MVFRSGDSEAVFPAERGTPVCGDLWPCHWAWVRQGLDVTFGVGGHYFIFQCADLMASEPQIRSLAWRARVFFTSLLILEVAASTRQNQVILTSVKEHPLPERLCAVILTAHA